MTFTLENIKNTITFPIPTIYRQALLSLMLLFVVMVATNTAQAQDFPAAPNRLVNDYTGTLSSSEAHALEQKLLLFEDSTSIQIAVVLVKSTDGYDIADYAVRLAQKWGVGQAKYDNGIMVLAAIGDRAVTIQTGYGVEGAVPDAIAYRIIENDIKPAFRQARYYEGMDAATNPLIRYTQGEYKADPKAKGGSNKPGASGLVVLIIIFIIISIISKNGGGNNRGGKVMDRKGSSDLFWWMLLNGMGGSSGSGRSNRSGGGFGGGFGGGGSFGGGGGFGGFGGGGFGGGGASGRW